tara:strand:+ start:229 stop:1356 length:1128 start_codon:yes stop_codon:yes gene_type:complete
MANITIYSGSATTINGNTPFALYDSDLTFQNDGPKVADWCARRLGYPITDIELQDVQFFACFEEAITEYGAQVNRFNIRENLLSAQGNSTSTNFTQKLITPNLGRLIGLSKQYGSEVGSGGLVDWKMGHITASANVQDYDLTDQDIFSQSTAGTDIEIKRIFHQKTPAADRHFDPQFGSNYAMNSFGWGGVMSGVSYMLHPIYDDLLKIQQVEFDDTVRKSAYTFELINNKLKLFPRPQSTFALWFQYIETSDRDTLLTADAISDYSNFGYDNMVYSNINDPGLQWIKKYTLSLVKQVLGSVRSKYSTIPIPGSETNLDGETLRSEGAAEAEALIASLREDLEAASRRNLMEKENEITDFQQGMLNKAPLNIYIG